MSPSTRSSNKGKSNEKLEDKQHQLSGNLESDLVLVIGGKEFHENSHILRSLSDYFNAALRSGMKEQQEMRFEFTDKDPEEWELIRNLLKPLSTTPISKFNFKVAHAWFDEFGISAGIEACDKFLINHLNRSLFTKISSDSSYDPHTATLNELLEYFKACYQSNMRHSKTKVNMIVCQLMQTKPSSMKHDHWTVVCSMAAEHKECRKELWESLAKNLPSGALEKGDPEVLLSNSLLPVVVFAEVHRKEKEAAMQEIVRIARQSNYPTCDLRHSRVCAKAMERPHDSDENEEAKFNAWQALWS